MTRRAQELRRGALLLALAVLHFVLPELMDPRLAPDLFFLAFLLFAIRAQPGPAAVVGFLAGLLVDSLTPAAFGAGAFAYALVGYLAAWGKAVFFADSVLVNVGLVFVGSWIRDLTVLLVGRTAVPGTLLWQLVLWSPIKAAATALVAAGVLWLFHRWLAIRILA